jgi:surfeit locus 1 family protein
LSASQEVPVLRRKSLLWPSLFALGGIVALLGLGSWQVERLFWKEALIAERHAAVTAPPVALPASLDAARGLEYHRVSAAGTFLSDRELFLGATDADGHLGYHVIEPLRLASGAVLLVDRGFVPEDRKLPASRAQGEPRGEVAVTGMLRLPPLAKPHWFLPANNAERNYWFWVDIPAMAAAAGLERVLPFYVDADKTPNPGGLPVGGQTPLDLPNNHLQYAITWYALAAALAVIAVIFLRRRARGEES